MGANYHKSYVPWGDTRKFNPTQWYDMDLDSTHYDGSSDPSCHVDFTAVPCPRGEPCEGCGRLPRHTAEIIIAIDGACRGNGTPTARSSIGVFFARDSQHNISQLMDDATPTNQKAELAACLAALRKATSVRNYQGWESPLSMVVIKADSEYVVKGMTEWVLKWRDNGYKNARGSRVVNAKLFQDIDEQIGWMNEEGIQVLFWHVPRARNEEADALANAAFQD